VRTYLIIVATLSSLLVLPQVPTAHADTPGEAFCAENQRHLKNSNGEMPFEIEEAVTWLTQHFNMSETEAVRPHRQCGKDVLVGHERAMGSEMSRSVKHFDQERGSALVLTRRVGHVQANHR